MWDRVNFQPLTPTERSGILVYFMVTCLNWLAVFGLAVVIGYGLRLGLGL